MNNPSPLQFSLIVNGTVYGTQAARQAYQFAQAVIARGHQLNQVFFYQEGVLNASALNWAANDEFQLTQAWQELAREHQIALDVCVSAAMRRGIMSKEEAQQQHFPQYNLAEPFELTGLGQLAQALLTQDRVVQF